jgi:Flp pilus assembly pilin Flp
MVLIAAGISITIVAVVGTIGTELNATYSSAALRGLAPYPAATYRGVAAKR